MPTVRNQNIENNPMQRKEPIENTGVVGVDMLPAKNILTRRANHRHIFIIPQIGNMPATMRDSALRHEETLPLSGTCGFLSA
jgi:hypothetical protein